MGIFGTKGKKFVFDGNEGGFDDYDADNGFEDETEDELEEEAEEEEIQEEYVPDDDDMELELAEMDEAEHDGLDETDIELLHQLGYTSIEGTEEVVKQEDQGKT